MILLLCSIHHHSSLCLNIVYAGEYMVEYVSFGGGGLQGTPSGYETYAHGWRVFCVKLDNPSIRVNFYQTGSFTATIPDICPINQ